MRFCETHQVVNYWVLFFNWAIGRSSARQLVLHQQHSTRLLLPAGESVGNTSLAEKTVAALEGDVVALVVQTVSSTELGVLLKKEGGEAPLVGDDNVLATGELVRSAAEGLNDLVLVLHFGADREHDGADVDAGADTEGLTEGVTHTRRQSIGTGATKHFVLTEDVEGVQADSHVERLLTAGLEHVLVDDNTAGFETFGTDLLLLTTHQMHTQREIVSVGGSASDIVDGDLGVRDTTEVSRLDIRLVLAVTIASGGTATHVCWEKMNHGE